MKIIRKRCNHCHTVYRYVASGVIKEYNDDKYCPACKAVIEEALKKVPLKYEFKWVETKETTLEELLNTEKEQERCVRRVWPGLVNLNTNDHQYIRAIFIGEKKYRLSTWEKSPEYSIEKEVEVNTITGEVINKRNI